MNYRERLPSSRYLVPILKPREIQLPVTLLNQSCSDADDFISAFHLAKCYAALITSKNNGNRDQIRDGNKQDQASTREFIE